MSKPICIDLFCGLGGQGSQWVTVAALFTFGPL